MRQTTTRADDAVCSRMTGAACGGDAEARLARFDALGVPVLFGPVDGGPAHAAIAAQPRVCWFDDAGTGVRMPGEFTGFLLRDDERAP